jgi:hypothetical protein
MSAEVAAFVKSWCVGERTVTLTVPKLVPGRALCAVAEWDPEPPTRLSDAEWKQYRDGRLEALVAMSRELGITVALVDV